jgi:hypothetical protein
MSPLSGDFTVSNSIVCATAAQANAFNWTTVDHKSAARAANPYGKSLIAIDLIVRRLERDGGSENSGAEASGAAQRGRTPRSRAYRSTRVTSIDTACTVFL